MPGSFKILAVDGGGIRGIIPALILAAVEEQTKRPICDLFDLIAGTSTGGIIALGLVKPDNEGRVEKSARDIVRLYEDEGMVIFPQTWRQVLRMGAIRGAKYDPRGIDTTLRKYFGDTRLKDALKPVLVPSYDIEKQTTIFFKSWRARDDPSWDFAMRQVARATSAAPTYFPPERIPCGDPLDYYALIDGGVVAGNPALCAYAEAIRMLRESRSDASITVVSLGTGEIRSPLRYGSACVWGQVEWAQPVIDVVLQGSNSTVDYQLQQLLQADGPSPTYFRYQVELSRGSGDMDDASSRHLKSMIDITQDYLSRPETRDSVSRLCEQLVP